MLRAFLIKIVSRGLSFLGSWPTRFISWWVSTGYFLFLPTRRRNSVRLYQVIFPDRGGGYHLYCAWKQFHSFAATFGDRIDLERKKDDLPPTPGREGVLEANRKGTGGILLMSHLGSFEVAARAFQKYGLRLLLMMGEKEAKMVARDQRETLSEQGVTIQVASGEKDSVLGGLEAIKFIREGGFVSLAGDLIWTDQRALLPVTFFNREVKFASGPYLLALITGAPLFILFTFRIKRGQHRIMVLPPRQIKPSSPSERNKALQESAQAYAEALEEMIRQHPFQWYIFESFFPSEYPLSGRR